MNKLTGLLFFSFLLVTSTFAQKTFTTGCSFDQNKYEQVLAAPNLTTRSYESLPSSYSLKKYCPTPGDQGSQSSCVGWGSTYAGRTILESIGLSRTDASISKAEAFSPSFVYNQIKANPANCNDGSYISDAVKLLKNKGSLKLYSFPYGCYNVVSNQHIDKAKEYIIKDYIRLTNGNFSDKTESLNAIKKAIADNSPVVFGMTVYNSFFNTKDAWSGITDSKVGGHAMCIIGYDDTKLGGAFEIMNSWGTSWGNGGFCWVKYDDLISNAHEAYQLINLITPKPVIVEPVTPPTPPKPEPPTPPTPPKPEPPSPPIITNDIEGGIKLVKDNGDEIQVELVNGASRDFEIVEVEKPVYKATKSIFSGDKFRIYFTSKVSCYIYILSYGTTTQKAKPIFPFKSYSAYIPSGNSEVAIPNEKFYIQVDKNTGTDFLTFVYSKQPIDIQAICDKINSTSGSFISKMKEAFTGKILFSKDVAFDKNKAGFIGKGNGRYILPISIQFEHK